MRKVLTAMAVGAMSGAAMLAVAAGPANNAPEARVYMNFDFGGAQVLPRNFHYGLRLDRDRRYSAIPVPFMQMDFDAQGNLKTHLNGMYLMRRSLIATQDEAAAGGAETVAADAAAEAAPVDAAGAEAAPADAAAVEAAPADAAADPFATTEPAADTAATETIPVEGGEAAAAEGTAYTAADWGLIVLGAAGVAYAGYEVSKSDDDSSAASGNSTGGGGTTGGGTTGGGSTGGLLGGLLGLSDLEKLGRVNNTNMAREYVEWLDGGSGHMGDLEAAR